MDTGISSKLQQYTESIRGKRVLIMGLGLQGSGLGATKFFARAGAIVKITDLKTSEQLQPSLEKLKEYELTFTLGKHDEADFLWADVIVVNPDVWIRNPNSPFLELAREKGKQIETESGLFVKLSGCPVIGITGTRGKTTTTIATAQLLRNAGLKIVLGGNVPQSETLNLITDTYFADYAVLELSNFQLHGLHLKQVSPHIAVITSISPDHLISYPDMEAYVEDKKAIYQYQHSDDYLIVNTDKWGDMFAGQTQSRVLRFSADTLPSDWKLAVKGQHNRENLGAVYQLGELLQINKEIIKQAITSFNGVEFRLQTVAQKDGISFVNDTTASTPTAALIALKSFPEKKIIWIAGGYSKQLPYDELIKVALSRVKKIVLLEGTATAKFQMDMSSEGNDLWPELFLGSFSDFKNAITVAYQAAQPGDVILLSPGFASFGMFVNEFERGRLFNRFVKEIIDDK